ncbi:MAG TPA: ribonuclease HII [Patescibacteria group bacterium]|nr:ribonuclease HII [Patescibacteria group bacterium]
MLKKKLNKSISKKGKGLKKINFVRHEETLNKKGFSFVCGVDEVGRGPWAGPITAAAVIIERNDYKFTKLKKLGIRDSKKLDEERREKFYEILTSDSGIDFALGWASAKEIDRLGMSEANNLIFKRAIKGLKTKPDYVLSDGFIVKKLGLKKDKVIKGDRKILTIAAASIIAKVSRDRHMKELAKKYPCYGFDKHKGYGTKEHQTMIKKYGICSEHRKSFKPISQIIQNSKIKNQNDNSKIKK